MVRYHEIIKENSLISEEVYSLLDSTFYNIPLFRSRNQIEISDNREVKVHESLDVISSVKRLPNIKILKVKENFIVTGSDLETLENSPIEVGQDVNIVGNQYLTSLIGLPTVIPWRLDIVSNRNLKSLDGINVISSIEYVRITYSPILPLLRLLLIKDVQFVNESFQQDQPRRDLQRIFNKYIQNNSMSLSEKRIRCKLELLEYPEYRMNARW